MLSIRLCSSEIPLRRREEHESAERNDSECALVLPCLRRETRRQSLQTTHTQCGIGASLLRKEDDRHLRGRGEFVSDIRLPGAQEVVFLRSPHAHACIRSIAVPPEARGSVFTAADLPWMQPIRIVSRATGAKSPAWPPLATDKVRYVGEAIAACVAQTRGEAEDIANSVVVEFAFPRCGVRFAGIVTVNDEVAREISTPCFCSTRSNSACAPGRRSSAGNMYAAGPSTRALRTDLLLFS